tara:strand:- start:62 stop:415 length:354 start_codon:yes stop_codon:yes gene_type:complete
MSWENTLKKKLELNEEEMTIGFGRDKRRFTPEELKERAQKLLDKYEKIEGAGLYGFIEPSPFVFSKEYGEIDKLLQRIVERLEDASGLTAEMEEEDRQRMSHPDYNPDFQSNEPYFY